MVESIERTIALNDSSLRSEWRGARCRVRTAGSIDCAEPVLGLIRACHIWQWRNKSVGFHLHPAADPEYCSGCFALAAPLCDQDTLSLYT